jgi:predicted ATPase
VYLYGSPGCGKTFLMDLFFRCAALPPAPDAGSRTGGGAAASGQPVRRGKRRAHFHSFMLDVHARLHRAREREREKRRLGLGAEGAAASAAVGARGGDGDGTRHGIGAAAVAAAGSMGDPVPIVARELAAEVSLLCLDEMQVTDVGDAMILRRLFECIYESSGDNGFCVVATSNRAPTDLYKNGLQREVFVPFIRLLEAECAVHCLDSPVDYRLLAKPLRAGRTWITPAATAAAAAAAAQSAPTPSASAVFEQAWLEALTQVSGSEAATELSAQGRVIPVPRSIAVPHHVAGRIMDHKYSHAAGGPAQTVLPTARFTFEELCAKPLFSADYQAIARAFGCVYLEGIPSLTLSERNELRRFIVLVDTLYEHRVKLVALAAEEPALLFKPVFRGEAPPSEGAAGAKSSAANSSYDEVFAFERTASRLAEMRSEDYINSEWRPDISKGLIN